MPAKKKPVKGFKANQKAIAKRQGVSMAAAGAILASGARKASAKAKKKNPSLKKVKGTSKRKKPRAKSYY